MHHLCWTGQGARSFHRPRRCLLKGCEQWFAPSRPQSRYCSSVCVEAARRWRRAKASRRYRTTEPGRACRREQHRRYRQRQRERLATSAGVAPPREGQRPACQSEDFVERLCDRPGCYVTFLVTSVLACQRFCSVACRLALRRVLDREAGYRQRRRRWRRERVTRRCRSPNTS